MKNLNITALATAITLIVPVSEGCFSHIQNVQDDTHQQVEKQTPEEREKCLLRAELAEQKSDFKKAAELYAYIGDKIKAQEMYLKYAQKAEQDGNFGIAGEAYRKAGDGAKAKESWLEHARGMEKYAYKVEEWISKEGFNMGINIHLCSAAHSYEEGGDEIKAKEIYLKYAQLAEQRGYLGEAARVYEHIGDKANARRLWLKFATESERWGQYCDAAEAYEHIGYVHKAGEMHQKDYNCGEIDSEDISCM